MDKVYCKTKRIINVLPDTGPLLDVEYVPDPSYTWDEVTAFFKKGKFVLRFEGPDGLVSVQPVKVSTATSLTDQPGILVALGQNDPKRVLPGCQGWLERVGGS